MVTYQVSKVREESLEKGIKRTIILDTLQPKTMIQYNRDSQVLSGGLSRYGYYNSIHIINNSETNIRVELDFNQNKSYIIPKLSSLYVDEVVYQEFNVYNDGDVVLNKGEVLIYAIFERPLLRESIRRVV